MHPVHGHVLGRQADGADVRRKLDRPVEANDGDVEAVSLGSELEVGVNLDLGSSVGATRQGLGVRLEDVLAEGDPNLRGSGSGDAVAGGHDVPLVHQRATAPRSSCKANVKFLVVDWVL